MNYEGLNALWNSGTTEEMLSFYSHMSGLGELMDFCKWRKERATEPNLLWSGGVSCSFAVVILTPEIAELNGPAIVFRDQPMFFVTGRSTFFNESHFFNAGIARVLKLDPKWIVLMSDDLWEVTPARKLSEQLAAVDNDQFDTVWIDPAPTYYHSYEAYLATRHPLEKWMGKSHHQLDGLYQKFGVDTVIAPRRPITKPLYYYAFTKAFPRPPIVRDIISDYGVFLERGQPDFKMTSDFAILSSEWCRKQGPEVLNESFLAWEDMDLSMRLRAARSTTIDFRLGSEIGHNYKPGMAKALKELLNLAVFNHFLREGKYEQGSYLK